MDIWAACKDVAKPKPLRGELIRVVESQERVATNALVDSLEEQALLEELLETSKPPALKDAARLHYLLSTPFRYPPLKHGSRFGGRHEPSLFYGAKDLSAALAETAYYRFVFWSGMEVPPPSGKLTTEHTVFGALFSVRQGLCLYEAPFIHYEQQLTDPKNYADTQELGQQMRKVGIEAFEYRSARDPDSGINIALYSPSAFSKPAPVWQEPWMCEISEDDVSFYNKGHGTWSYQKTQFLVDGELPAPSV